MEWKAGLDAQRSVAEVCTVLFLCPESMVGVEGMQQP